MLSMTNLGLMASSASPSATVNDRNSNYNNGVGVRPLTASASIATNLILMAKHHQQHHLNHFHQQRHSNSALMSLSSNTITSIPPSPSISLNSASSSLIPIKDFAPSSMVSSVSSAWDTWEDGFDLESTVQVQTILETLDAYLYGEISSCTQMAECQEWLSVFPHIRIRGRQLLASKDIGFEVLSEVQARAKSPYFFFSTSTNPHHNHHHIKNNNSNISPASSASSSPSRPASSFQEIHIHGGTLSTSLFRAPHLLTEDVSFTTNSSANGELGISFCGAENIFNWTWSESTVAAVNAMNSADLFSSQDGTAKICWSVFVYETLVAIADDPFTTNPINPEKIIIQAKLHGTSDSFEDFFQRVDAFIRSNPDIISSTNSTPPSSSSASRFTPFILLRCADSVLYTATKLSEFSEDKRSAMLLSNNSEGDKVTIIQDGDDTTSITRGSSNSSVSVDNLLLLTWSSIHFAQQQTPPSFTFLSALDLFRSLLSTYDTTTHDVALPSSPPTNPNIIITSTDILIQFEKTLPHCKILECHVPDLAQLFNHPSSTNMSLMAQNLQIAFTREESWMNSCLEEVYAMEGWIDECFAKDDSNVNKTEEKHSHTIAPQSPSATIKQNIVDCIFDDLWSEVTGVLGPLVQVLGQDNQGAKPKASKKELLLSNDEDIDDIDEIGDIDEDQAVLFNANLLSAMTIRPIPLQKREFSARSRTAVNPQMMNTESSGGYYQDPVTISRPASARISYTRPTSARPSSARYPPHQQQHPELLYHHHHQQHQSQFLPSSNRISSAAINRAAISTMKRNNVGMRLLPLQSSHNNMMLNDMVYGTSIQKYSSVSAAHSESVYNTSRPSSSLYSPSNQNTANKRLPPLRSAMNNYEQQQYQQQQQQTSVYEHSMTMNSKSSKHVLFDATEHHRAAVVDAARLRSMSPAPHLNRPFSASNLRRQSASNPRARSAKPPQLLEEAMSINNMHSLKFKADHILHMSSVTGTRINSTHRKNKI